MAQLIPCPGCNRHVRQSESSCPFCSVALTLADTPPAPLPRSRLGRAATFAFGATLVGATALVGCGGDDDDDDGGGGKGGSANAGAANGGSTVGPVYGAPAAAGNGGATANGGSGGGAGMANMGGSASALYGAPPSGGTESASAGTSGTGNFPVYGAPPAEKK